MESNPFSALVEAIREDSQKRIPAYYRFGNIVSENPLKVNVGGIIQDSGALFKNASLSYFNEGDRVLLIPIEDEQRYVIVCKVVEA